MKVSVSAAACLIVLVSNVLAQYTIDPDSVSTAVKDYWCQQQQAECPLICLQTQSSNAAPTSNDCNATALTYSCVCSNGHAPNVSEYSQTLPFFICQEWGTQCVSQCGLGNNACAADCTQNHPCGALNPTRVNSSAISGGSAATATPGSPGAVNAAVTTTGSAAPAGPTGGIVDATQGSGAARAVSGWALGVGRAFGTLGLVGALVAGAALLL